MTFLWSRLGNEKGFIRTSLRRVSFLISLPSTWTWRRPAASHRPYYGSGSVYWEFAQILPIYTCNIPFGNIQVTTIWKCIFCNVFLENYIFLYRFRGPWQQQASLCAMVLFTYLCVFFNTELVPLLLFSMGWEIKNWRAEFQCDLSEKCAINRRQIDFLETCHNEIAQDIGPASGLFFSDFCENRDTAYHRIPVVSIIKLS